MGESTSGDAGGDSATAGSSGVLSLVILLNVFHDCDGGGSTVSVIVLDAGVEYEVYVGHLEFIYLVLS